MSELVKELWASDQASALTNRAARRIETLEAALRAISKLDDDGRIDSKRIPDITSREVFRAYNQAGNIARAALNPSKAAQAATSE